MWHEWDTKQRIAGTYRGHKRTMEDGDRRCSGGDRGTRTPNLRDANAALSQLSYIPTRTAYA